MLKWWKTQSIVEGPIIKIVFYDSWNKFESGISLVCEFYVPYESKMTE